MPGGAVGRSVRWCSGLGLVARAVERLGGGFEPESAGALGVGLDGEALLVDLVVVAVVADRHEVGVVGGAVVLPFVDVV